MSTISRRAFLRHAAALGSLGTAAPLGLSLSALGHASAQASQTDYKALVCIFMYGGNDAYNTVLATDDDSWRHYVAQRDLTSRGGSGAGTSIALLRPGTAPDLSAALATPARLGGALALSASSRAAHAGRRFALNPLLRDVQQLYESGRVAVLAGVGPLQQPLTKAQYEAGTTPRPAKLFSHNDQQSTWQSFSPEGADAGWGGRMGDLLMAGNAAGHTGDLATLIKRSFTCVAPGTSGVWLSGEHVRPLQIGLASILGLGWDGAMLNSTALQQAMAEMMGSSPAANVFSADHQQVVQRALAAESVMRSRLPAISSLSSATTPWATPGQGNPWADAMLTYRSPIDEQPRINDLAMQLQMVARMIEANRSGNLGIRRQVFMVALNGFDNHDAHNAQHNDRMAALNHGLAYFDRVLSQMPGGDMRSQVTTFTASEFGRSLTNNGDGTDHGWGAHHLIMGGAVRGREVYGAYPQLATNDGSGRFDSPDLIQNGIMLPTTSVEQYAFTLGRWLGVSDGDLRMILPNLAAFNSSSHDLGFMG